MCLLRLLLPLVLHFELLSDRVLVDFSTLKLAEIVRKACFSVGVPSAPQIFRQSGTGLMTI